MEDYMDQNAAYEDVLEKINQKLALKDAIERANKAIAASKQPSRFGGDDDTRSQASKAQSQYSRRPSQIAASEHMSKASMRSAAQDLVQTLQVQLERERQQKRKLQEHLEKIEEGQRM